MNQSRKQKNLYGNIMLVGHEGDCLGRISEKRANFYLKKDLAFHYTNFEMTLAKDDDTKFIKLKFPENGLGKQGQKFFMAKRENQCVVCGEKENLNKTYIVPKEFRNHMPDSYKLNNDYDLMLMCIKHHNIFSQLLQKQKNDLIKKCGFKEEIEQLPNQLKEVKKAAILLLSDYSQKLPEKIRDEKCNLINKFFPNSNDPVTLYTLANLKDFYKLSNYKSLPQKIVERYSWPTKRLNDFIISWRIFFTMSMIPKFLPEYWTPYDNLVG